MLSLKDIEFGEFLRVFFWHSGEKMDFRVDLEFETQECLSFFFNDCEDFA